MHSLTICTDVNPFKKAQAQPGEQLSFWKQKSKKGPMRTDSFKCVIPLLPLQSTLVSLYLILCQSIASLIIWASVFTLHVV